jgi:hypothetical protein
MNTGIQCHPWDQRPRHRMSQWEQQRPETRNTMTVTKRLTEYQADWRIKRVTDVHCLIYCRQTNGSWHIVDATQTDQDKPSQKFNIKKLFFFTLISCFCRKRSTSGDIYKLAPLPPPLTNSKVYLRSRTNYFILLERCKDPTLSRL